MRGEHSGGPAPRRGPESWLCREEVTSLLQALGGNGTPPPHPAHSPGSQECLLAPGTGLQRGQGWGSPQQIGAPGGLGHIPGTALWLPEGLTPPTDWWPLLPTLPDPLPWLPGRNQTVHRLAGPTPSPLQKPVQLSPSLGNPNTSPDCHSTAAPPYHQGTHSKIPGAWLRLQTVQSPMPHFSCTDTPTAKFTCRCGSVRE